MATKAPAKPKINSVPDISTFIASEEAKSANANSGPLATFTDIEGNNLVGDNTDWLGKDTKGGNAPRTVTDALNIIAHNPTIARKFQAQLKSLGILTGKYSPGNLESGASLAAAKKFLTYAATQKQSITQATQSYASQGITSTAKPTQAATELATGKSPSTGAAITTIASPAATFTDAATIIKDAQDSYMSVFGREPTQGEEQDFVNQVHGEEVRQAQSKYSTDEKTNVDPAAEAQLFAESNPPAGASKKAITQATATINKTAVQMGVTLTPAEAKTMATQSVNNSWSADQLTDAVAKKFNVTAGDIQNFISPTGVANPNALTGNAASILNDMQKLNGQYMVPVGNQTMATFLNKQMQNQAAGGTSGVDTAAQDEYENYLRTQAAINYPGLSQSTGGFTTATPYTATESIRQTIASMLGIQDADSIDLTSPTYQPLLASLGNDGTSGIDLSKVSNYVVNTPSVGWANSAPAISSAYQVGSQLLKDFGKTP